jgi:amino-acid N-acetyltransferase
VPALPRLVVDDVAAPGGHLIDTDTALAGGVRIEKAKMADVEHIFRLVTYFADRDEMLHRPLSEIYENLRDFYVARSAEGEFLGCVALHLLWSDLAEIKSLAVREDRQLKGVGTALVRACLEEARRLGLPRVFALTYKPGFFEKLGFRIANVMNFPRKVWNECYRCPKFPSCNEIAVSIDLTTEADAAARRNGADALPVLPPPEPRLTGA